MKPSQLNAVTLVSETGFTVEVLPFGGIITKILALDAEYNRENVVLAYENLDDYLMNPLYLGCVVGPVAGRTRKGRIPVPGGWLALDTKKHPNSLHSGDAGFHKALFKIAEQTRDTLVLTYEAGVTHEAEASQEAEVVQGAETQSNYHTVTLTVTLTYRVSGEALTLETHVTSSEPTYASLTNHSYFNLSGCIYGHPKQTIAGHMLTLGCSHYARLDEASLPIELVPLKGSCFDFTAPRRLGDVFAQMDPDVLQTSGIDHPFKCGEQVSEGKIASLLDPGSGRVMTVKTSQPYVVIYSGNFLDAAVSTSGIRFAKYAGICFETQDLPNVAGNKLDKLTVVTPDAPYMHRTIFEFSTLNQAES